MANPTLAQQANLGAPVTTRTLSWNDMCMRAWGSEWNSPDHNVYQFSGGRMFDSTDQGKTGVYGVPVYGGLSLPNTQYPDMAPNHVLQLNGGEIIVE